MRFFPIFSLTVGILAQNLSVAAATWLDTHEAGLKLAKKEKKDILISFVGTGWCAECEKFEEALLSKDSFAALAGKNFVLVELDFPQTDPEVTLRNEPVRANFGVMNFPVLVLTDSEGLPYGELRMRLDWTVADYLKALNDLDTNKLIRDEARAEFESAADDDSRVLALEKLLRAVPETSIPKMYGKELEALRKASKDKSPLVAEIAKKDRMAEMQAELQQLMGQKRYDEAAALCDRYLANDQIGEGEKQMGMTFKFFALFEKKDFEKAILVAKDLQKIAPRSPVAQQAVGLQKKAEAALKRGQAPLVVREVKPEGEQSELGEKKGKPSDAVKTQEVRPDEVKSVAAHKEVLKTLDAAHEALTEAEKALAQAEADLAAAQKAHLQAHEAELKARPEGGENSKGSQKPPSKTEPKKKKATPPSDSQVGEVEKRATDLRKQAEELRKKARELREDASE